MVDIDSIEILQIIRTNGMSALKTHTRYNEETVVNARIAQILLFQHSARAIKIARISLSL
jgi:hypothetical protein